MIISEDHQRGFFSEMSLLTLTRQNIVKTFFVHVGLPFAAPCIACREYIKQCAVQKLPEILVHIFNVIST